MKSCDSGIVGDGATGVGWADVEGGENEPGVVRGTNSVPIGTTNVVGMDASSSGDSEAATESRLVTARADVEVELEGTAEVGPVPSSEMGGTLSVTWSVSGSGASCSSWSSSFGRAGPNGALESVVTTAESGSPSDLVSESAACSVAWFTGPAVPVSLVAAEQAANTTAMAASRPRALALNGVLGAVG